jgi:hypothetical protein
LVHVVPVWLHVDAFHSAQPVHLVQHSCSQRSIKRAAVFCMVTMATDYFINVAVFVQVPLPHPPGATPHPLPGRIPHPLPGRTPHLLLGTPHHLPEPTHHHRLDAISLQCLRPTDSLLLLVASVTGGNPAGESVCTSGKQEVEYPTPH